MSSILAGPNLRQVKIDFDAFSSIKLEIKKTPKQHRQQLSLMEVEEENKQVIGQIEIISEKNNTLLLGVSLFKFSQKGQEPIGDESLNHLANFL